MESIGVDEIGRDPLGYLRRAEAGETLLVLRADKPVAEIKPVVRGSEEKPLRPAGLAAGGSRLPTTSTSHCRMRFFAASRVVERDMAVLLGYRRLGAK